METLEFDHNVFNDAAQAEGDKNLAVRFYTLPVKDEARSIEEGRPIFTDTPMIEIRVRGDRNNIVIHPVREDEKRRFGKAWDAFQRSVTLGQEGTPLGEWPPMSGAMVEEMKYLGFHTVEDIANANEVALGKVTGLRNIQVKAKLFLEMAKGNAPIEQLTEQMEKMRSQTEMDKRTLDQQALEIQALKDRLTTMAEKLADTV